MATEATEVESEEPREEPQQANEQKDSAIALSIRTLQEESLQISELSEMERNYASEVSSLLRQLIEPLNTPFHIKPASVSNRDASLSDVVLTPQGVLFFMHGHGTINSRPLETLPSEVLVKVLSEVIPQIKKVLIEKRQKIAGRVATLEKIGREFKKIVPSMNPRGGARPANQRGQPEQMATPHIIAPGKGKGASGQPENAMKAALSE